MKHNLWNLLERFDRIQSAFPGPIPDCVTYGNPTGPHLVIGLIVHGNEVGSLPQALETMESLAKQKSKLVTKVSFFLGNRRAALNGSRFLETDLNRVFYDAPPPSLEAQRAKELKVLLGTADLFIDVHQAYRSSPYPFYIFAQHSPSDLWAKAIGAAPVWVTRPAGEAFDPQLLCADEWVRARGVPAITLELGYFGFSDQADGATSYLLSRALELWALVASGQKRLEDLSLDSTPLRLFWPKGGLSFRSPFDRLKDGINNFDPIYKDDVIGLWADGSDMVSPCSGVALFPQYPERDRSGQAIGSYSKDIIKFLVE